MALTKIDDRGLKTPIDLLDNEKIRFGTGNDLEIYHDGSDSYIRDTGTGSFYIDSNQFKVNNAASNESMILATENGAVALFYDNSQKLVTGSGGIVVSGSYYTNDGNKIYLGSDNDLELFHDGSNAWIKNLTGVLVAATADFQVASIAGDEQMIRAYDDGAVQLYYDNSKKFETTSTGIQVTDSDTNVVVKLETSSGTAGYLYGASNTECGILDAQGHNAVLVTKDAATELYYDNSKKLETTSTGVTVYTDLVTTGDVDPSADGGGNLGSAAKSWYNVFVNNDILIADNGVIQIGDGNDLQIYHNGSDSYIDEGGTGDLKIRSTSGIQLLNSSENYLACIPNGAVELYYNNSKKFETNNTGFGGLGYLNAGPASNNGNDYHDFRSSNDNQWLAAYRHSTGTNPYGIWMGYTDASPDANGNEFIRFDDSTAQRFRVNSDGDIYTHDSGNINSDRTMKENIVDASPKLDDLMKLKVRNFTWKKEFHPAKEGQKKIGFIAQEVEEVFPKLVTESNVAPLGKPDVIKKEIKQAWAPILVKALQEAVTKIETLETEVAALKAK